MVGCIQFRQFHFVANRVSSCSLFVGCAVESVSLLVTNEACLSYGNP